MMRGKEIKRNPFIVQFSSLLQINFYAAQIAELYEKCRLRKISFIETSNIKSIIILWCVEWPSDLSLSHTFVNDLPFLWSVVCSRIILLLNFASKSTVVVWILVWSRVWFPFVLFLSMSSICLSYDLTCDFPFLVMSYIWFRARVISRVNKITWSPVGYCVVRSYVIAISNRTRDFLKHVDQDPTCHFISKKIKIYLSD